MLLRTTAACVVPQGRFDALLDIGMSKSYAHI